MTIDLTNKNEINEAVKKLNIKISAMDAAIYEAVNKDVFKFVELMKQRRELTVQRDDLAESYKLL